MKRALLSSLVLLLATALPAAARTITYPDPTLVVNVVTDLGFDNTGTIDVSEKFQAAIDTYGGHKSGRARILYFPKGTYLISREIVPADTRDAFPVVNYHIEGESETETIIKLRDNADGTGGSQNFNNPALPRAMFRSFGGGWTNNSFMQTIENITFDVGSGNLHAIGLAFHVNNSGGIRNVTIRSSDPQRRGARGLDLTAESGACGFLADITIEGFDYGVYNGSINVNYAMERITLRHQRVAGLRSGDRPISIRRLVSQNSVPAVKVETERGQLVLIDSELRGGAPGTVAIENTSAFLLLRNVTFDGYAHLLRDKGAIANVSSGGEYVSHPTLTLWDGQSPASLALPIEETPVDYPDPDDSYVIDPTGLSDHTAAIQAAMDSGKSTIYFKPGFYRISETIRVGGKVRVVDGMWSKVQVADTSLLYAYGRDPAFLFVDGEQPVVTFKRFQSNYLNYNGPYLRSERTKDLVIRDIYYTSGPLYHSGAGGRLFLEDVFGLPGRQSQSPRTGIIIDHGQPVWARFLNVEFYTPGIRNVNGTLWVLGYKFGEDLGPYYVGEPGSRAEFLGGSINSSQTTRTRPEAMFVIEDAALSLTTVERYLRSFPHEVVVRETRNGVTREIRRGETPLRLPLATIDDFSQQRDTVVPLFTGYRPADQAAAGPRGRLANFSARGRVGQGEDVLIGGLVITGAEPKRVAIVGRGASLADFGVPGALADAQLQVFATGGAVIGSNENFGDLTGDAAAAFAGLGLNLGAATDSAVVVTLAPGAYTAILRDAAGVGGVGLLEIYDLDPAADSRLANFSARARVGDGGDALIGGLVITGERAARVGLAVRGPSLSAFDIGQPLENPTVTAYQEQAPLARIADRDGLSEWERGEFSWGLPPEAVEPASVKELMPGLYTYVVRAEEGVNGVALLEFYRLDQP